MNTLESHSQNGKFPPPEGISETGAIQFENGKIAAVPLYFYAERGTWYGPDGHGSFSKFTDSQAKSFVAAYGFSKRIQDGHGNTAADLAMIWLNQNNRVSYAGLLAGYRAGLHEISGTRILVTESSRLITPMPGDWVTIRLLVESLFFDEQYREQPIYFYVWLSASVKAYCRRITANETDKFRHCPALAMFGPLRCGKSALIDLILTPLFGGRKADPMNYLREGKFNKELFAAGLLALDDKGASANLAERRQRGEAIKDLIWKPEQRMEGKNLDAVNLRPFWRLVIAGNDDDAGLQACPALSPILADKIMILHAQQAEGLPQTHEENDTWAEKIRAELPAFVAWLLEWNPPEKLVLDPRTRVANFQHPQIVASLRELQPEMRLLELIDTLGLIDADAPLWEGKSSEFESAMRSKDREGILTNNFGGTSTGRMLSELARTNPDRVKKTDRQGTSHYKIFRGK